MRLLSIATIAVLILNACSGGAGAPAAESAAQKASAAQTSTELKKTASGYPARPISFIVPYAAGGGSDIMVRSLDKIAQDLKVFPQNFTVSNVAGGSGFTGKAQAYAKPADGYTLTLGDDSTIFGQLLGQEPMKYTEFTYLARIVSHPKLVVDLPGSPYKTLTESIDAANT